MCPPRAETQAAKRLRHFFYCAVNQLMIDVVPFIVMIFTKTS